jgi:hypothetical protein
VAEVFFLSEGEKHLLLSAGIGEGLFFAGAAHAAIRVIASPQEHALVTTKPQELEAKEKQEASLSGKPTTSSNRPIFTTETVPDVK